MKGLREKLRKHEGFTLVEMLIVVAIIAILIAVSIPMMNNALEKARHAVDEANIRSAIGLASAEVLANNHTTDQEWQYVVDANHQGKLADSGGITPQCLSTCTNRGPLTVNYTAASGEITAAFAATP